MPKDDTVLITGANGEIGHGLIHHLCSAGASRIITTDIQTLDPGLQAECHTFHQGDITDPELIQRLGREYAFTTIYHLASILSTKGERDPELAHRINVDGTLHLLRMATEQSRAGGRSVKFIYPSSIAAYGLPDLETKAREGRVVREDEWCVPATMYGVNKLTCEHLGRYYALHYRRLEAESAAPRIDFRALRFPGLISALTIPTGGTSDYGPEMLHHAAQDKAYACFVRPDSQLPFMVMPDAIKALLLLEAARRENLRQLVYNVTSYSPTAAEILEMIVRAFPSANITFAPDVRRQGIVDSWPADVDDSAARRDWGWQPEYDFRRSFQEYLIPSVRQRYA
jgi:nucleoside-diphosphate-sugar epimerase